MTTRSAFVAPAASRTAARRVAASPSMLLDAEPTSRRALLASLVLAVPAAANAMIVPGLNAPGLVPAKKVKGTSTGFGKDFEEIRDRTNFWSSKGIMDSVPKVKGIITPKGSGAGQQPMK